MASVQFRTPSAGLAGGNMLIVAVIAVPILALFLLGSQRGR